MALNPSLGTNPQRTRYAHYKRRNSANMGIPMVLTHLTRLTILAANFYPTLLAVGRD